LTGIEVSVIIACRNARRTIRGCLDSLAAQRTSRTFEVIVADSSTDGTDGIIRAEYPWVRMLHFETRKFPGDARNAGIREARGELLAFIDSDCTAAPDWLECMATEQRDSDTTVGGVVDNGARGRWLDWAGYFCEFSQWMPPGRPCWMDDIPTCNLSFHRELFDEFGPFIEGVYCSDTALHWKLARAGRKARFVPAIQVAHHGLERLWPFLSHEYFHGRSFARLRVKQKRFAWWRRWLYVCGAPLLPAVLWRRIAGRVLRNRRYVFEFLMATPLLVLGLSGWSLGEARGYLRGERG
jgi:glycosyltransferase involved in cell wall biosynthesis